MAISSRLVLGWLCRWRWWLAVAATVLVVRGALPWVLRRVIEAKGSEALDARLSVGNIDLGLLAGWVVVDDLAIHPLIAAAPATSTPAAPAPANTPLPEPPGAIGPVSPETVVSTTTAGSVGAEKEDAIHPTALIAWKRLTVQWRWWPLFRKVVQFKEILLESPRIALDRLADGQINLLELLRRLGAEPTTTGSPGREATPTATPTVDAAAPKPGWGVGIDSLVLADGGVRFRDLMIKGSEPIDLRLERIAVSDIALRPGLYGEPGRLHLDLAFDDAAVRLDARVALKEPTGVDLKADLEAQRLPLRRAHFYIPGVGWSDLEGKLDAQVAYRLETDVHHEVRGTAKLYEVSVMVPEVDRPALTWESLSMRVDPVDLMARRVQVSEVTLDGATLLVRARTGKLPLLMKGEAAGGPAASATPAPSPAQPTPAGTTTFAERVDPTPTSAAAGSPAPPAASSTTPTGTPSSPDPDVTPVSPTPPPVASETGGESTASSSGPKPTPAVWDVSLAALRINRFKASLLELSAPLDVTADASLKNYQGLTGPPLPLDFRLGIGAGTVALAGAVRLTPPGFGGTLKVTSVPLSDLAMVAGGGPEQLLKKGNFDAELVLAAGMPAGDGAAIGDSDVRVSGRLGLTGFEGLSAAENGLLLNASSVALNLAEINATGLLPGAPVATGRPAGVPARTLTARGQLDLGPLKVASPGNTGFALDVTGLRLALSDTSVTLAPPVAPGDEAGTAKIPDVRLRGQADVSGVALRTRAENGFSLGTASLSLGLDELTVGAGPEAPRAGESAATRSPDLRARGQFAAAGLQLSGKDPRAFAVGFRSFVLPFPELAVPSGAGEAGAKPLRVALGDVLLDGLNVQITRKPEGLSLPNFSVMPAPSPDTRAPATTAGPTTAPPAATRPAAGPFPVDGSMKGFRLSGANVGVIDRTVKPFLDFRLTPIDLQLVGVEWPGPKVQKLRFSAVGPQQGRISIFGSLAGEDGWVEVHTEKFALAPFNPYATQYSSYSIKNGAVSLSSKVSAQRDTYYAENWITLHNLNLQGAQGDSLFQQNFGVPLSVALALLRDTSGNIELGVPLSVNAAGAQVDVGAVVRSALRQALVGALTSPLKLVGAFGGGDKVESLAPSPIGFPLGRAALGDAGREQVKALGGLLGSRPGIVVSLTTAVTAGDVRWLREQALLAAWGEQGFFKRLGSLPQRGARNRVQAALEARAKDQPGELSAEDTEQLDRWLDERPSPPAEQLHALATQRLTTIQQALHDDLGIPVERIRLGEPPSELAEGTPLATFDLGVGD